MASQWSRVEEDPSDVFSDDSDRIQRFFCPALGLKYSLWEMYMVIDKMTREPKQRSVLRNILKTDWKNVFYKKVWKYAIIGWDGLYFL